MWQLFEWILITHHMTSSYVDFQPAGFLQNL
jgi:hypothetical protein